MEAVLRAAESAWQGAAEFFETSAEILPVLVTEGLPVTLAILAGAAAVAVVAALAAGLGRVSVIGPWRWLSTAYVETFRGTSALVQLFWFYFALPRLGVTLPALAVGIVVLGLNTGSYGAEVVRGAIRAVPKGQWQAATALGFTRRQTMRRIILPQAALRMLPPAGNLLIELLKNTALALTIGLTEVTFRAQALRTETLETAEIFTVTLVLYFVLAQIISLGMRVLEERLASGRGLGGRVA